MARSVADKFSKREDVLFLLSISMAILVRFHHLQTILSVTRYHGRRERGLVSFFIKVQGMWGCYFGGEGSVKTTY